MHDHRVGRRNIDSAFDDCGRQKHVIFPVVKGIHPVIKLTCRHLAMRNDIADLGNVILQKGFNLGNVLDPRHHKETLPAAIMFAQKRLAYGDGVEFGHIGADRQAIHRRRTDDRQIPHPGQRHLQGSGDRRGREGQNVDVGFQRFQPLFVGYAKSLFFIYNQKSKILKTHAFGQKCMGADHDVHRAVSQFVACLRHGLGRHKP